MTLLKPNEPWMQTAAEAAQRRGVSAFYGRAAQSELLLRNELETFLRLRRANARICHEMVMGEGRVRADVVAIDEDHIIACEVKGEYDDTTRLLHQVGMYQLCVPEVWMVVPIGRHAEDARLIRHLIPSVGLLVGSGQSQRNEYEWDGKEFGLTVEAEAAPRQAVPKLMLEMLWADELRFACQLLRVSIGKKATRASMITAIMAACDLPEMQKAVCAALRGRDALWRADAPVPAVASDLLRRDEASS